ncbi:MAG: hypothetical protein R3E97_06160 [Candidatus Eisenbacteria bacterium]
MRGRGPEMQSGNVTVPDDPQGVVGGAEVVDDAGELDAGRTLRATAPVGRRQSQPMTEPRLEPVLIPNELFGHSERGKAGEMGMEGADRVARSRVLRNEVDRLTGSGAAGETHSIFRSGIRPEYGPGVDPVSTSNSGAVGMFGVHRHGISLLAKRQHCASKGATLPRRCLWATLTGEPIPAAFEDANAWCASGPIGLPRGWRKEKGTNGP